MNERAIPVPQRGLLILLAAALLASGALLVVDGDRDRDEGPLAVPAWSDAPIVLRDVTVVVPVFHEAEKVDVNAASTFELQRLPGIGPALAERIVAHRTEHGPFDTIDGLQAVSGIGPQTVEGLRDAATIGEP